MENQTADSSIVEALRIKDEMINNLKQMITELNTELAVKSNVITLQEIELSKLKSIIDSSTSVTPATTSNGDIVPDKELVEAMMKD